MGTLVFKQNLTRDSNTARHTDYCEAGTSSVRCTARAQLLRTGPTRCLLSNVRTDRRKTEVKTVGPVAYVSLPPKDSLGLLTLVQQPQVLTLHSSACHFSKPCGKVTHLSSSGPLAGSPRPHSSPPQIHPIWFSGSLYYRSPLLSPVPSCPFWVAAYGQAGTCGTVAAAGSRVTGR